MYRSFMNAANISFVASALPCLLAEAGVADDPRNFWVCYGSFVLNQQTPESDLDLLLVHRTPAPPVRLQARYRDHQVTIYSLPLDEFGADGQQRRYGGYFSAKLLNPYVVFGNVDEGLQFGIEALGGFIGSFATAVAKEHGREIGTRDNLVADCILAYFRLCPAYASYFLRYFVSPEFIDIWNRMKVVIPDALVGSKMATRLSSERFEYHSSMTTTELHEQLVMSVARFWAFGACCHGGSVGFPDYYTRKALNYIESNGLTNQYGEMQRFLAEKADRR